MARIFNQSNSLMTATFDATTMIKLTSMPRNRGMPMVDLICVTIEANGLTELSGFKTQIFENATMIGFGAVIDIVIELPPGNKFFVVLDLFL